MQKHSIQILVGSIYHLALRKCSSVFNYYVQNSQEISRVVKKKIKIWWISLCNLFIKLIVRFCATTLLYAFLLHFLKYLWFTYEHTHAGAIFISSQMSPLVIAVMRELDNSIIVLSFTQCVKALLISFSIGLFAHFTVIKRYFYDARGWFVRLSWVFTLSTLAGCYGDYHTSFTVLQPQVVLLLFPVCCLINVSFALATKCLPEFASFFQRKNIRQWIETAHIRNMNRRGDGN